MRQHKSLGIVCPMANEGNEAVEFCKQVLQQCDGFQKATFFAVFDRATRDSSLEQMRELEKTEPRLKVVWAPENRCAVDAYLRGYREALAAHSDWILEIDAGFSHRPEDIPQFFTAMDKGRDCVFGSRFLGAFQNSSAVRHFVSWGGTRLSNLLLGTRQTDMTSGFQLFSSQALSMILDRGIQSRGHFFQTEMKVHCRRLNFVEVPIIYSAASPRLGKSSVIDAFQHLWRLFKLRLKGQM